MCASFFCGARYGVGYLDFMFLNLIILRMCKLLVQSYVRNQSLQANHDLVFRQVVAFSSLVRIFGGGFTVSFLTCSFF